MLFYWLSSINPLDLFLKDSNINDCESISCSWARQAHCLAWEWVGGGTWLLLNWLCVINLPAIALGLWNLDTDYFDTLRELHMSLFAIFEMWVYSRMYITDVFFPLKLNLKFEICAPDTGYLSNKSQTMTSGLWNWMKPIRLFHEVWHNTSKVLQFVVNMWIYVKL